MKRKNNMVKCPPWFNKDIKKLLDLAENLGLNITDSHSDESTDGIYFAEKKEISLDIDLYKRPHVYIYTVLHEIGHHLDEVTRGWLLEKEEEILLKEVLAGIYAYILHKNMCLTMPQRFIISENAANIEIYLFDIKTDIGSNHKMQTLKNNVFCSVKNYLPTIYNIFGVIEIPESLLKI
jgi:hypothetical protein